MMKLADSPMRLIRRIQEREGILQSLRNISWLGADRITRMLGAVIVGTQVARYLGPSQFGLLNYALAIYGLFNLISNLGLDSIVVRDIAVDENGEPKVLGTSFVLKMLASVGTTIAAIGAAFLLEPHNKTLIVIVALMSFASISQALDVLDFFFQGRSQTQFAVFPRTVVFVIASAARMLAVLMHGGLLAFAWIAALEVLITEIGLGISYLRFRRIIPRWDWNKERAKAMLAESWPLLVASLMITIDMRVDQVLLAKMSSMAAAGTYAAAIRLSEIWYSIPMIVSISVMPRILRTRELSPERYNERVQILYQVMILVSLVATVCTLILGPTVIRFLYGQQFSAAASILSVHIWTGIFVAVGCIGGQQYVHDKVTISSIQRTALAAIVNVVLNLWWIPRWAGMGSAMATLVSYSLNSYFADAFDSKTRHIFRMKTQAYLRFWTLPIRLLQGTSG